MFSTPPNHRSEFYLLCVPGFVTKLLGASVFLSVLTLHGFWRVVGAQETVAVNNSDLNNQI